MNFTKFVNLKPGKYYDDKFLLVGFLESNVTVSSNALCDISIWKVMKGRELSYGEYLFEIEDKPVTAIPKIWCAIEVEL